MQNSPLTFCFLHLTDTTEFSASKLHRGFEFTPLRHAVWSAEIFRRYFPRIPRKMPIFRDYSAAHQTAENRLLS